MDNTSFAAFAAQLADQKNQNSDLKKKVDEQELKIQEFLKLSSRIVTWMVEKEKMEKDQFEANSAFDKIITTLCKEVGVTKGQIDQLFSMLRGSGGLSKN